MRLRSQSPTTSTTSSAQQSLPTGQNSVILPTVAKTTAHQVSKNKFRKRLSLLRAALLIGALALTGMEVVRYIPQAIEHNRRAKYFVYTRYFPQSAAYSPNGKYLAVCTPIASQIDAFSFSHRGSKVDLHEAETGKKVKPVYSGNLIFDTVSFSRRTNRLFAHSNSRGETYVYDLGSGKSEQVLVKAGALTSGLNLANNSVVRIYKDRIAVQHLDKVSSLVLALPKKLEVLDGSVTGLMFSRDTRFINWTAYSSDLKKRVLRLADMETGHVYDLQTANGSSFLGEEKPQQPIVVAPDRETVYLSGNVHQFPGSNDFSHGIAEVDLKSGKITRSQYQSPGINVSHVKGKSVF